MPSLATASIVPRLFSGFGQSMGFQLIRVDLDPGLGEHDPAVHDQAALDPPDPHSDQASDADMGTGEQGAEPEPEELQENSDEGDRYDCY
jgi:hypothetical protein